MDLTIYTDGGSLNNPGPSAAAYLIYAGKKLIHKDSFFLGVASNNVAEYTALIRALEHVVKLKKNINISSITCIADSQLLINQLKGVYKIKHPDMKKLSTQIKLLEMAMGIVPTYHHVLREKNQEADDLVRRVLLSRPR